MEVYGGLRKAFVRLFIIKSSGPSTGVLRPGLDLGFGGLGCGVKKMQESEARSQVGLIVLSCQLFAILGVAWTVAKLLVLRCTVGFGTEGCRSVGV